MKKDEDGEAGSSQLDPGELCMVPFLYMAWGSLKDLSMEASSLDFRKIIAICIKGLEIHIFFDPAILPQFILRK